MNMDDEIHDDSITTPKSVAWSWLVWFALALVLYVLSFGPVVMFMNKSIPTKPVSPMIAEFFSIFYLPLVYTDKMLGFTQKPLRMYLHLWVPDIYDSKGNYHG
jgi:hypothetical protein